MQKLHLVGITTDQEGLILSVRRGARSGAYVLPVDEDLDRVLDELRAARREAAEEVEAVPEAPAVVSALPVREVQARLRQGHTVAQVAKAAGVGPEWVERFAAPVLAECAQVAAKVRSTPLRRARLGESRMAIGDAVRHHLADRGVALTADQFTAAWSARQVTDGRWVVQLSYRHRGRDQVLHFELDQASGEVTTSDRVSSQMGYVAPDVAPAPPARPRPAPSRTTPSKTTGKAAAKGKAAKTAAAKEAASKAAATARAKAAAQRAREAERTAARRAKEKAADEARRVREAKAAQVEAAREQRRAAAAAKVEAARQREEARQAAQAEAEAARQLEERRQAEQAKEEAARKRAEERAKAKVEAARKREAQQAKAKAKAKAEADRERELQRAKAKAEADRERELQRAKAKASADRERELLLAKAEARAARQREEERLARRAEAETTRRREAQRAEAAARRERAERARAAAAAAAAQTEVADQASPPAGARPRFAAPAERPRFRAGLAESTGNGRSPGESAPPRPAGTANDGSTEASAVPAPDRPRRLRPLRAT